MINLRPRLTFLRFSFLPGGNRLTFHLYNSDFINRYIVTRYPKYRYSLIVRIVISFYHSRLPSVTLSAGSNRRRTRPSLRVRFVERTADPVFGSSGVHSITSNGDNTEVEVVNATPQYASPVWRALCVAVGNQTGRLHVSGFRTVYLPVTRAWFCPAGDPSSGGNESQYDIGDSY